MVVVLIVVIYSALFAKNESEPVLSRSAVLELDIATGGVSVCLSVCPSHAGSATKLMIVRISLWVAEEL